MGFIKRGFYSMKYRKGQNIVLTVAYTLLFALTLGILLVYLSMSSQVDYLQKALGSAVTLRGPRYLTDTKALGWLDINPEDMETFLDSPYVETYNHVGNIDTVDMEGGLFPVVPDSKMGYYTYVTENHSEGYRYNFGFQGDCTMVPVSNSQYYDAFTIYGFKLVEGTHFTPEDKTSVLISTALAERNGLKIGDQITFSIGNNSKQMFLKPGAPRLPGLDTLYAYLDSLDEDLSLRQATLTICGLFETPNAKEMGYTNEQIPEEPDNLVIASYDATEGLTSWRTEQPVISFVTAYLKSPSDVDAFLQETREKLVIEDIFGSQSDYGFGESMTLDEWKGSSSDSMRNRFKASPWYTLYLDNEWYDIVAKPLESVRNLMGIFLAVVLLGSALVLALVVLLSLRGRMREFGILLAIGETKRKIVGQIFVEVFLPLLAAAVIGLLLGTKVLVPLAEDYSASLLSVQSREEQTDLRAEVQDVDKDYWGQEAKQSLYFQFRSPRTLAVVNSVPYAAGLDVYGAYFALDFGMVLLILLIQMLSVLRVKPARILTRRE